MTKIGLLAGAGDLPFWAAQEIKKTQDVFVIAYAGAAEANMKTFPHQEFSLLEINSIVKKLKEEKCDTLTFIGKVMRPASVDGTEGKAILDFPPKLVKMMYAAISEAGQSSDDLLMTTFARYLEEVEGFTLVGVEQLCPALTMDAGFLCGQASAENEKDIALAVEVVQTMGDLNVGQAAAVVYGQVLAVEAAEGTDKMLERVCALPEKIRGNEKRRAGVLIKLPRRHQDLRLDMPTIGVATLNKVAQAGLAGIVVKEKSILIDDKARLKKEAEKAGIFIQALTLK